MLDFFVIPGLVGVVSVGGGYKLQFDDGSERDSTQAEILAAAKAKRRDWLNDYHAQNGLTVIEFTTSSGVTKLFDADPVAIGRIQGILLAAGGALPEGFYWVAADNVQVPFSFTDLQGLAATIFYHGWLSFNHLQTKKAEVDACLTAEDVESVNW